MQVRDISVKKRLFFANFMMVFIPVCLLALIGAAAFAGLSWSAPDDCGGVVRGPSDELVVGQHAVGEVMRAKDVAIVHGPPGTGKTWMAQALATRACQAGIRTRWVTYPFLCRELIRLKEEDSKRLEARMAYYAKFELLCIDEFPNADIDDRFIMQEFFNLRNIRGHSTIVSGQCEPRAWDSLFEIKSFAQSIRGRLLENAIVLEMKGPDLRTYDPDKI